MTLEDRVIEFFRPGGRLSRSHPGWEPREVQSRMAAEVRRALEDSAHAIIEAGTGTGKTLAYLVPAALSGRRVIVSTGTKALQDQIARSDIPFLVEQAGLRLRAEVLKGRDNYLCVHRHDQFRQAPLFADQAEARSWSAVEEWARSTEVGDLAELTDLPERPSFWSSINASNSTCLGSKCPRFEDCHLQEVRRRARAADIVVVNHHLFLADTVVRESQFGEILPQPELVIFDEAHRLEAAATSFFGRTVSSRRVADLGTDLMRELERAEVSAPTVLRRAREVVAAASGMVSAWGDPGVRRLIPARLPTVAEDSLGAVSVSVRALDQAVQSVPGEFPELQPFVRRSAELLADLELLRDRSDPTWVHWYEVRMRTLFLTATPVDVAPMLRERVYERLSGSVTCSATLSVGGELSHARRRLGLEESSDTLTIRELVLPSPFDYAEQGLLYLPPGLPNPRDPEYAAACARTVEGLLEASGGRAFLLFTSYENMHRVHAILEDSLPYPVHVQGEAPKHELRRRFIEQPGSVLFATASFWEGVDVPGPALSLVVVDKLPFAVPSDPVVAARTRLVEDRGGNGFRDLSLPEAVLSLKQGVGRLIRSRSDRGVVAVLDPRVRTARYGRAFVRDLPPFRRTSSLTDVHRFFAEE